MNNRREAIVKAYKRAGLENPTEDDLDTACGQLDGFVASDRVKDLSGAEADRAVSLANERKRIGAEKAAQRKALQDKSYAEALKLRQDRQKHRDERRRAQSEKEKGRDGTS